MTITDYGFVWRLNRRPCPSLTLWPSLGEALIVLNHNFREPHGVESNGQEREGLLAKKSPHACLGGILILYELDLQNLFGLIADPGTFINSVANDPDDFLSRNKQGDL